MKSFRPFIAKELKSPLNDDRIYIFEEEKYKLGQGQYGRCCLGYNEK